MLHNDFDNRDAVASATSGDTIYIGASITCSARIVMRSSGVILKAKTGVTPVLDFSAIGNVNSGSKGIGIYVTGSNNTIYGLIIQKAKDNGIKIEGASNTVGNCIFRYNGDTGLQISKSTAKNNTIKYCDSYRNCGWLCMQIECGHRQSIYRMSQLSEF